MKYRIYISRSNDDGTVDLPKDSQVVEVKYVPFPGYYLVTALIPKPE